LFMTKIGNFPTSWRYYASSLAYALCGGNYTY